jgi:hypothetical protein
VACARSGTEEPATFPVDGGARLPRDTTSVAGLAAFGLMLLAQAAAAQHREGAAQAHERDEKEDVDGEEDKKQGSFCICV